MLTARGYVGLGLLANYIGSVASGVHTGQRLRMVAGVHGLEDEAGEGVRFAIAKHGGGAVFHLPDLAGLGVELEDDGHGLAVLLDLGGGDLVSHGHVGNKHVAGKNLAIRGLHIFGENFSGFHGDGGWGEAGQDLDGWALLRGDVKCNSEKN